MERKVCPSASFIFQNIKEIRVKKNSFLKVQTKRNSVIFVIITATKMKEMIKKTNSPKGSVRTY